MKVACPKCGGSGKNDGGGKCIGCHGKGKVYR